MEITIHETKEIMGRAAAKTGAVFIREAIKEKGSAAIILATGASQFEMLNALVKEQIDWTKVSGFHLDEYIELPESHPASFRKYLRERFVEKVPIAAFHYINGEQDPELECQLLRSIIQNHSIDVAFIGIGENGHLAFNDPPADFETQQPYIAVALDESCRKQQLGEGWFNNFEEVPRRAISMSVKQILKSQHIICTVPDLRKADAVKMAVKGPVTPEVPASILQQHSDVNLFLDMEAASLLNSI
ncbi:glucosamine-6-phosphate deaminase [Bacteroidota bacterium]